MVRWNVLRYGLFFFFITAAAAIFVFIFIRFDENETGMPQFDPRTIISVGPAAVSVEVVATPEVRKRGLSGKSALADGTGMFFVFDAPGIYPFWMKDMNFPIDIVWIDADLAVADVTLRISPETYPMTFQAPRPVQYVLEVPAGWVEKNNIQTGDRVMMPEDRVLNGAVR